MITARNMPKEMIDFISSNYSILGKRGCAKHLGLKIRTIETIRSRLGVSVSASRKEELRRDALSKTFDEYSVNPEKFINISTPEAAYLLGFIWADGHVVNNSKNANISISQERTDMNDIKPALDRTGRWNFCEIKREKENHKPCLSAYISNRPLANHLMAYGYRSKSIGTACPILSTIPSNLKHYFFRGLFDGDGCLFFKSLNTKRTRQILTIASSYHQDWTYMANLCEKLRVDYKINRTTLKAKKRNGGHQGASTFQINRHQHISVFLHYIYDGRETDHIGLNRKWMKYQQFNDIQYNTACNRYQGVSQKSKKWEARIPKKYGLPKALRIGVFDTEDQAYEAQQNYIFEHRLIYQKEHVYGPKR